jgi:hypothetical protein
LTWYLLKSELSDLKRAMEALALARSRREDEQPAD